MLRFRYRWLLCLFVLCLLSAHGVAAQTHDIDLSDAEVEKLRDAAYIPADRIAAYVKILDVRSGRIQALVSGKRKPGREQQLHDLFDQFNGIAEELSDNLDEYGPKHRDVRKALPKLMEATERWSTVLRSAAEDPAYKVVQRLALDTLHEVHESAATMNTEQVAYFKAHPDAAKAEKDRVDPQPARREVLDIPR